MQKIFWAQHKKLNSLLLKQQKDVETSLRQLRGNDIFTKDINAYALNKNVVEQSRNVLEGNSLTEPDDIEDTYMNNI